MTFNPMIAGAMTLALMGTGCATKKYVAQSIAPVEARVETAEVTNGEQDTKLSTQGDQIEALESDLSLTNERLADAANSANSANTAAQQAQTTADSATTLANNAMEVAEEGISIANQRAGEVEVKVDRVNNYQMASSETVLFDFDKFALTADAKFKLDEMASRLSGKRYMVEVQGYTDRTGDSAYNERLSERRADAVARYLVNEHKVALRSINLMGSGYAAPVGDDTTADGRKMNRRVEVRLFVPELETAAQNRASN
jgi:outer membrane protein OmpA-like peptidoglycan-associated protein